MIINKCYVVTVNKQCSENYTGALLMQVNSVSQKVIIITMTVRAIITSDVLLTLAGHHTFYMVEQARRQSPDSQRVHWE